MKWLVREKNGEYKEVYILGGWDSECVVTNELLAANSERIHQDGKLVTFIVDNGDATYRILPITEDDKLKCVVRLSLIESTYSPPPVWPQ